MVSDPFIAGFLILFMAVVFELFSAAVVALVLSQAGGGLIESAPSRHPWIKSIAMTKRSATEISHYSISLCCRISEAIKSKNKPLPR